MGRVFWLVVGWLIFVGIVVVADGIKPVWNNDRFDLSDPVLIALITTTTINVIGLFFIVLRYLFPNPNARTQADDSQTDRPG